MQRTKRITVRLEPLIVNTLSCKAEARELSVSAYVRAMIIAMLEANGELDPKELYKAITNTGTLVEA